MLTVEQIAIKFEAIKRRNYDRDIRMNNVLDVRRGKMHDIAPDFFPEGTSKAMVANFVDVAARDVAEVLAPLPSFNCISRNNGDRAKKNADTRTLIANNYIQTARLQTQMYTGADWYGTYGFLPFIVEPNEESGLPFIRIENPMGSYPEFDRFKRLISFSKRYVKNVGELIAEFPEYQGAILAGTNSATVDYNAPIEMIRYEDADQIVLFLPTKGNFVLQGNFNQWHDNLNS